jgi:HD-GYP domain-containing protein (c-di-GMP phosphodiesterase class II)
MSLSEALDRVSPAVTDHQLKVAYIATHIARAMGIGSGELPNIFHAAALHDIGVVRAESRVRVVGMSQLEGFEWHQEVGYQLLKDNPFFDEAAPIVRYHHLPWNHGEGAFADGHEVPIGSHIVGLADNVERMMDREGPILDQVPGILARVRSGSGDRFHPDCVDALVTASRAPSFWLDCTSLRVYGILASQIDWPMVLIDEVALEGVAAIFARVVDCMSPWTATHSAGVATAAEALARKFHFSPSELRLMRSAGYLHDIGKVTVPDRILNKPGKLTEHEMAIVMGHPYHSFHILSTIGGLPQVCLWASLHHEHLSGTGYPFGYGADQLTLGSRVMAVADAFTAMAEDRPYRKGMDAYRAMNILHKCVSRGELDAQVVGTLGDHLDEINSLRQCAQATYRSQQEQLLELMAGVPS